MTKQNKETIRKAVRKTYAAVARTTPAEAEGCGTAVSPCCGADTPPGRTAPIPVATVSERLGYGPDDLAAVPEGADMGLGCGNPAAIAGLKMGETVLDLGSGGGIDCFIAARKVGAEGHVIGVDMTPEMIGKARAAADKAGAGNVEFRLGEIEHLPVADNSVDVILSNCVINLSPDKAAVYQDAFRVLKPGGRLSISDIVATAPVPPELADDLALVSSCVGGAATVDTITGLLSDAGFVDIHVTVKGESREFIADWQPGQSIEDYVASATIEAVKPG
ncbi:MAG: arsenite methyltransferase [Leptospirillia bacterium]